MNRYYFTITYWNSKPGQSEYSKPIYAETYSQALDLLYKDESITGALLIVLHHWTGITYAGNEELYNPSEYDVPVLALA